jgi:hypothetical protein
MLLICEVLFFRNGKFKRISCQLKIRPGSMKWMDTCPPVSFHIWLLKQQPVTKQKKLPAGSY